LDNYLDSVEVKAFHRVDGARRGSAPTTESATPVEAEETDVVELAYANGLTRLAPVELLQEEAERGRTNRGVFGTIDGQAIIRIPPAYGYLGETRGSVKDILLETVKLLSPKMLDDPSLENIKDQIKAVLPEEMAAKLLARGAAWLIAAYFEGLSFFDGKLKIYDGALRPGPGLYLFNDPQQLDELRRVTQPGELSAGQTYLVFLHGTASSSAGSFGKLGGQQEWRTMQRLYGDRILAFNHPTLSLSPIHNAVELAKLLPANAKLHLVSHSRGGLVGELLSLPGAQGPDLAKLVKPFTEVEGREEDERALRELIDLLGQRNLQIERFVRIACPTRGTILASGRLDVLLNGILNAIKWAVGGEFNPYFRFAKAITLALFKARANAYALPGLEAMMPESPLIHLINHSELKLPGQLTVIAGDIEGAGLWRRLLVGLTNLYYLEQHDLVVNTKAMRGGFQRETQALYVFDQGSLVNHFNYCANEKTRDRLLKALEGETEQGFEPMPRGAALNLMRTAKRAGEAKELPVVFVLPDLMGSHLQDKIGRVWLEPLELAYGGLRRLALDAQSIKPDGLVGHYYQGLVNSLANTYEVIPFAYDWRLSIEVAAKELAQEVESVLKRRKTAVHFIGHGLGGLVARAFVAGHKVTWQEVCRRRGRMLMLGAPNNGSYAVAQLLAGRGNLLPMLRLLDPLDDQDGIHGLTRIFGSYPALLEILPEELLRPEGWQSLPGASAPSAASLDAARQVREKLAGAVDPEHMVYVAGSAPLTPAGYSEGEFTATTLGDGRVTYDSGKLKGVPAWVMDAEHGDLATYEPAFPALRELLERGTTDKLPQLSRVTGVGPERLLMPPEEPAILPDAEDLITEALGSAPKRAVAHALRIAVAHGELRQAAYPIAVGHYQGDSIVSAEAVLDQALGGRLSQRFQAGLYPGADGTVEVVYAPDCQPSGALIIGLGEVGGLTADKLRDGVMRAALSHALAVLDVGTNIKASGRGWRSAAFSSLLLGTYGGNALTIEASVTALAQGALQANRALQAQNLWDRVRIDEVELIELYEDVAIQAAHAVADLVARPPIESGEPERLEMVREGLIRKEGGRFQRPANQYATGWWQRLQITGERPGQDASIAGLRFLSLTDRARAEDTAQPTQRRLIDGLVAEAVQSTRKEVSEELGLTLFELLIPNSLKDDTKRQTDMVLVVDKEAAQYPWELLAIRCREGAPQLALQSGMIRQFKTGEFRLNPRPAQERNALVIGDTVNKVSALPGARREAEGVATRLRAHYGEARVVEKLQQPAKEIINAVFARDYSVIHLAGHGLYDPLDPTQSGMVLSDGLTLSTAEIRQLRIVPELVFINCCHLANIEQLPGAAIVELTATLAGFLIKKGAIAFNAPAFRLAETLIQHGHELRNDPERLSQEVLRELNLAGVPAGTATTELSQRLTTELVRLRVARNAHNVYAASIAEELIKMGVKAVVAAGWAVDDEAAATFANTFYDEMFRGRSFGEAVLAARQAAYNHYSHTNTWGAYQCYGNPGFKLHISGDSKLAQYKPERHLSQREYRDTVRSITAATKTAGARKRQKLREQLTQLEREIRSDWLDGQMLGEFARAWADLGDKRKAIELYRRAIADEKATICLNDIEQLANLEGRYAAELAREGEPKENKEAEEFFTKAVRRLQWLLLAGPTIERLTLLGSHYKRQADSGTLAERARRMEQAARYYRRASNLAAEDPARNYYYPALNWVSCRLLQGWNGGTEQDRDKVKAELIEVIEKSMRNAEELERIENDFFNRVAAADGLLCKLLVNGKLNEEERQGVVRAYQKVLGSANERERGSVFENLDWLSDALKWSDERRDLAGTVEEISAALMGGEE
jgi:hypothetical protein